MTAIRDMFFEAPKNSTLEELESYGTGFAEWQRGCLWYIGDLARYAEARFPDTWNQVFPEWISPGLVARCKGVAAAYPREEDRNPLATWSVHKDESSRPDRNARVEAHVQAGRTSDEARAANKEERATDTKPRWLLAFDIHMKIHAVYGSGAGVETAKTVSEWAKRTVDRLKLKGVTDALFAFEGVGSFRKELTKDWQTGYKSKRGPKDPELIQQISSTRDMLRKFGFCCVRKDTFEADDCLASAAAQFNGNVTIVSGDKDLRQCLSHNCNILLSVEWNEDDTSGEMVPDYKWLTAKENLEATGIRPLQWPCFQTIMGDSADSIQGVAGIGPKGATDLIQAHGSAEAVIQAAKDGTTDVTDKKRQALIDFEPYMEITKKLVTLVKTLPLPETTRI